MCQGVRISRMDPIVNPFVRGEAVQLLQLCRATDPQKTSAIIRQRTELAACASLAALAFFF